MNIINNNNNNKNKLDSFIVWPSTPNEQTATRTHKLALSYFLL